MNKLIWSIGNFIHQFLAMLAMVMEVMMSYFGMICSIFEEVILDRKKNRIRDNFKVILRSFVSIKLKRKKIFGLYQDREKKTILFEFKNIIKIA